MLGAVFMATDMVGSPMTRLGCVVIYGVLIGVLVVVIRVWGGMPEGVMYAILLGNAAVPAHRRRRSSRGSTGTGRGRRPHEVPTIPASPAGVDVADVPRARRRRARAAALIVTVFEVTGRSSAPTRSRPASSAVLDVLPGDLAQPDVRADRATGRFVPASPEAEGGRLVFAGYDDGALVVGSRSRRRAWATRTSSGALRLRASTEQAIVGIRVLDSRETPGLGDRVETDADFLANFEALDVSARRRPARRSRTASSSSSPARRQTPGRSTASPGATITSRGDRRHDRREHGAGGCRVHRRAARRRFQASED